MCRARPRALCVNAVIQWISEVMHFCPGLPIILVACKKDLRRDPRVVEELKKTNQRPVIPEEVCNGSARAMVDSDRGMNRAWPWHRRLGLSNTSSALLEPARVFERFSSTRPGLPLLAAPRRRTRAAPFCKRSVASISLARSDDGQCDGGIVLGWHVHPGLSLSPFLFLIHLVGPVIGL